jgi:hypothetical protein
VQARKGESPPDTATPGGISTGRLSSDAPTQSRADCTDYPVSPTSSYAHKSKFQVNHREVSLFDSRQVVLHSSLSPLSARNFSLCIGVFRDVVLTLTSSVTLKRQAFFLRSFSSSQILIKYDLYHEAHCADCLSEGSKDPK